MRPDFYLLRNFIPALRYGVYVACAAKPDRYFHVSWCVLRIINWKYFFSLESLWRSKKFTSEFPLALLMKIQKFEQMNYN